MTPLTCPHGATDRACDECAAELEARPDPETMSREARADEVRELLTTATWVTVGAVLKRVAGLVGRDVFIHELALEPELRAEALSGEHPKDLTAHGLATLRELAGPDKPIIAINSATGQVWVEQEGEPAE